jgi:acetyl esterase/lipase
VRYAANMDPELRPGLAKFEELGFATPLNLDTIPAWRTRVSAVFAAAVSEVATDASVIQEDRLVPGPDGAGRVPIRIYRPINATPMMPCLYWIHGGGMILGTLDMEDLTCEAYAERAGCVVVAVDYRLAPEHPHPAPVEDCYAGLSWTAAATAELGIDSTRLAVGGASAGGGLAAATVLLARDRGGPDIAFQLLVYPMLDDRDATPSAAEFGGILSWSREHNRAGWAALLGERAAGAEVPAYAAPARAEELSHLPPTLIQVGELEVFRDEDVEYAARLLRAGVSTELHVYPGAFHGCDTMAPGADVSVRMFEERIRALRRALHPAPTAPR